ncbi:MAG: complex I subunit 5 family protein [Candidatus Izemoplasmatales bacterium]
MIKFPKMKIFDSMVKGNTFLVGFSLFLLLLFIAYIGNWFGFNEWVTNSNLFNDIVNSAYIDYSTVLIIFIPIIGAIIELLFGEKLVKNRDKSVIYMGFLTLVIVVLLYPFALERTLSIHIPNLFSLGLNLRIDMLSYAVLMLSAFIWFFVMIYAHEYMKREKKSTRFFFFLALTYSSVIGAIVSGDLLMMFIFFEIMTITSYMLVIHGQNDQSYKAGFNYIIMGLIGGFLILTAIILLYFNIGDLRFESAIEKLEEHGNLKYWIMGLLVFGFGIKAGMAPVHVWLPRAHPVAPTPASALLSGVMIKIGAFGIIRAATSYYFPSKDTVTGIDDPLWLSASSIGAIIIWTGIITMALGVFMALQQANIKKMLAYHSISQMGYIITGIGVALYLGYEGAMGLTGAMYHIINHALFKSLLFMVAGVIYYHTKELDMYKLGGLWKRLPFTTITFIVAALGISGIPLFNGYISKTILHHGLVEAYELGNHMFFYAELIFIVVSAATVCSFIKMFYYVFIRKTDNDYKTMVFDYSSLDIAMWSMGLIIILIGLFPNFILKSLIIPLLNIAPYDPHFIEQHIWNINVFQGSDLLMTLLIVMLGFMIFFLGKRFNLFHLRLPKWFSVEYLLFYPAYILMKNICKMMYGEKCPIDNEGFAKLSDKDVENIGFIDRFVITTNVFNRRYEQSVIRSDALIYTLFITGILIYVIIKSSF